VKHHDSTLRSICESLINCNIRGQHGTHHVPFGRIHQLFSLVLLVEISSQMEQPRVLRSNLASQKRHLFLTIPTGTSLTFRTDTTFNFQCMGMTFGNAFDQSSIPRISITSLRENSCAAFKFTDFGNRTTGTPNIPNSPVQPTGSTNNNKKQEGTLES
jgi:hypothetical protein